MWQPAGGGLAGGPGATSLRQVATVVSWAAVIATVWSGLEYLVAARSLLTGGKPTA